MKRILSLITSALLIFSLSPLVNTAFAADDPQVMIDESTSGNNWINLKVSLAAGLPLGEIYHGECLATGANPDKDKVIVEGSTTNIYFRDLIPGTEYSCQVGVKRADKTIRYQSAYVMVKTVTRPDLQIQAHNAFDDYIDFSISSILLQDNEQYIVICAPLNKSKTVTKEGGLQNKITVAGLQPETVYNCKAGIRAKLSNGEYSDYSFSPEESIRTETLEGRVRIINYTVYPTTAEFLFEGRALSSGEVYFASCIPSVGQTLTFNLESIEFYTSSRNSRLTIRGLTPEELYSCNVGIQYEGDNSTRSELSSQVKFRTDEYYPDVVEVISTFVNQDKATTNLENMPLSGDQKFTERCVNTRDNTEVKEVTTTNSELILTGLQPGTKYDCVAGIQRKDIEGEPYTTNKSQTYTISTIIQEVPRATYPDPIIEDWSIYQNPFPDTVLDHISGQAAAELYRRGVITGYEDGKFVGNRLVNRAEAAKILLLARKGIISEVEDDGRFSDLEKNVWYTRYIMTAAKDGIISGYTDNTFRPDRKINRAEFLKMMSKTFNMKENMLYTYEDVTSDVWYSSYAGAAEYYKLFPDAGSKLQPDEKVTRFEMAIAIYQFLKNR